MRQAAFPTETVAKMGELGFMGIEIPEEYGGTGMDTLSYVLAMIEISKACASHGAIMSVNNSLVCHGIYTFGTERQKEAFLVPLASGEKLGAYSLTESQAGSDPANMRCTAEYDPETDEYVINGLEGLGDQRSQRRLYHPLCHDRQEPGPPGHLGLCRGHHAARLFARKSGTQTGYSSVSYIRAGL